MLSTSLDRTVRAPVLREPVALVVADANWYTTENLFSELDHPNVSTLLLKCVDYQNAWKQGRRPWSWSNPTWQRGGSLWERDLVLPSGWMKRFPTWGMRPIHRSIGLWRESHAPSAQLTLVTTYPHYLYLQERVKPDRHVYFNVDDYTYYWPRFADRINELELRSVEAADLTVCVSKRRTDELRALVPSKRDCILHLPHGAPRSSIDPGPCFEPAPAPDDLKHLPRPLLGYVGSLEDRVDWPLLEKLARSFPSASVVLIGRRPRTRSQTRDRVLDLPNVHALGHRPQGRIAQYNRAFDVCLIPYRVDHPFNQVCNPTKIMDYMGTGRPIVSTALPECRLYTHLFDVAEDAEAFLDSVGRVTLSGGDPVQARARHAHALENTCARVAERLLSWLP
ncbi:MAG TPA: glycosyltransferase [Isosphaeraceae bacterium]|nr:glycosyltransferase [Isosphaeraceae bacterium]